MDKFASPAVGLSRGMTRALIDFGAVWVNGKVCRRQSQVLQKQDKVTIQAPAYGPVRFYEADQNRIIYEDEYILAYDKEAGIPCQQTPYDGYNHLFGALGRLRKDKYLALHHRLDGPTSGVMVFSINKKANRGLSHAFKKGPMEKNYLAVLKGTPPDDEWSMNNPIAKRKGGYFCPSDGRGKHAETIFKVLFRGKEQTLVQARPMTGRTHQIRLHAAACGRPVIGDREYGDGRGARLMLHASSLALDHPCTGEPLIIETKIPQGFNPGDVI